MCENDKEKIFDQIIDRGVLISLVRERPVLWNKFLDIYKDKIAKTKAWREVCVILNKDFEKMETSDRQFFGKCAVKIWMQIKDTWVKSLQSNQKSDPGRVYKYHKELTFLKPVVEDWTHKPSADVTQDVKLDFDCIDSVSEHVQEGNKELICRQGFHPPTREVREENARMPYVNHNRLRLNPYENNDRHMSFFKSILPSLMFFDDDQTLEFQSKVIHVIQSVQRRPRY